MSAAPCANCGADSVATCLSCQRRICNTHMVISAEPVYSFEVKRATGKLNPVRLAHPVGESFVDQSDGPSLRAFCSGGPRCFDCRVRDADAADDAAERSARRHAERLYEIENIVSAMAASAREPDVRLLARLVVEAGDGLSRTRSSS